MSEENKEVQEQEEQKPGQQLMSLLKDFEDAPSQEQIDAWKKQFGDVFISGFSETEIFVWRSVRRPEFVEFQTRLNDPNNEFNQLALEEYLCEKCTLWRSDKSSWAEGKAGTPTALAEQIMQNSNFMNAQAASLLVAKL